MEPLLEYPKREGEDLTERSASCALPAIPKAIFQTCPQGHLRQELRDNISRLKALNPGWQHCLYGDTDLDRLFRAEFDSEQRALIDSIAPGYGVVRADIFRYLVLYRLGGVYVDIKSTMTRPLDAVLRSEDAFLLSQWPRRPGHPHRRYGSHPELAHIPGGEFQQWFLASMPGHPFLAATLARCFANMAHYDRWRDGRGRKGVLRLSGPICFTLAIEPLLQAAPHRRIDYDDEGLVYSLYEMDSKNGTHVSPSHYSRQAGAIIRNGSTWSGLPYAFQRYLREKLGMPALYGSSGRGSGGK